MAWEITILKPDDSNKTQELLNFGFVLKNECLSTIIDPNRLDNCIKYLKENGFVIKSKQRMIKHTLYAIHLDKVFLGVVQKKTLDKLGFSINVSKQRLEIIVKKEDLERTKKEIEKATKGVRAKFNLEKV